MVPLQTFELEHQDSRATYNDRVDHDPKADLVNGPLGNHPLPVSSGARPLKDLFQPVDLGVVLRPDLVGGGGLTGAVLGHEAHGEVPLVLEHGAQVGLEVGVLAHAALLLLLPAQRLAAHQQRQHLVQGAVVGGRGERVRQLGVVVGLVQVAQLQLRHAAVVVGLHVLGRQLEALEAVADDRVPLRELEARHGSVRVEGRAEGIGDYAAWWEGGVGQLWGGEERRGRVVASGLG